MTQTCSKYAKIAGIVLFASLALNLFLAGWLFGADKWDKAPPPRPGAFFESFNKKAEALPEPERTEVKKVLKQYQPKLKKQMRQIMQSRDALDRMFKRKDYSRAEAEERFNLLQEQSMTMQDLAQAMMLDLADAVPVEHRAKFMERPKEWRGKGAEFRHHGPKPHASHERPPVPPPGE
jgi:uncharacterized membrane protein